MNHDYAHCLDQTEECPKWCFRRQLNDELKGRSDIVPRTSWMHFADDCKLRKGYQQHGEG